MNKNHYKKLIAPIVIVAVMVLYYLAIAVGIIAFGPMSPMLKLIGLVFPILLIGLSVFVLVERIKEIRSGEEDDLSKY